MNGPRAEKESRLASAILARDQEGILGNAALAVSGQAAAFAAGLATMIVTARLLGPKGYGRVSMFFMILAVLSQVVLGWPNLGLVRFGREELGRSGVIAETFWARVFWFLVSLLAAGGALFLFRVRLAGYLQIGSTACVLLLLYVGLNETIHVMRSVFQTVSDFRAYAVATFAMRALKLPVILLVFLALALPVNPFGILVAHIASIAAVALWTILVLPWRQLLPIRLVGRAARRLFAYSWPLMLSGLSVLVVDWIDLAVIKRFHSAVEVGWYAISYQPVIVAGFLCVAFIGALQPLLVSLALEQRYNTLIWYLDDALPQIAWAAGMGCVLWAGLAEAIPLVLGEAYRESVLPCQVLMPGLAFSIVAALHAALAQAVDRVRISVFVATTLAVLNILLDIVLVPRIGILGAGVATTASFALSGLLYFPLINSIGRTRGNAPRRRYGTLAGLVPPLAFAVIAVAVERTGLRLAGCLGILVVSAAVARGVGVFRLSTLEKLDKLRMPGLVRILVRLFFRVFGRY